MQKNFEFRAFLVFLFSVSGLFFAIMLPFFGAIFWAITIAIIFSPLQKYLTKRLKRPNLAALLTLLASSLFVILPFLLIASAFLQEGLIFYQRLQSGEINFATYFEQLQAAFPSLQHSIERLGIEPASIKEKLGASAIFASKIFAQKALSVSQSTMSLFLQLGILLYVASIL